jgi:hypothetical protein
MKGILLALVVTGMTFGTHASIADNLTSTHHGETVRHVMNESSYGNVTVEWLADANLAGTLMKNDPTSLLLVPGINPDGTMSLNTATAFIAQLNSQAYLGITTWRLPTTFFQDSSCSFSAQLSGGTFGFACAMAFYSPNPLQPLILLNPSYVYSELAALFNALGGRPHDSIRATHNDKLSLFTNLHPYLYWSQTAQPNNFYFGHDFWFQNGFEGTENEYDSMYVLPVATVSAAATVPAASPAMIPACAVVINASNALGCTKAVGPGLDLNTTLPTPTLTLQASIDGKLFYDPVLNVTFLADANLAKTLLDLKANARPGKPLPPDTQYLVKGVNPDGSMNQTTLANFLSALNGTGTSTPYLGISTWNTPTTATSGDNPNCTIKEPGNAVPDYGYNCDGMASQLGELFYDELGGVAGERIKNPLIQSGRLLHNLKADYYWQCQPAPGVDPSLCAHGTGKLIPSFSLRIGYEGLQSDVNELFVMLVAPGNVIPPDQLCTSLVCY